MTSLEAWGWITSQNDLVIVKDKNTVTLKVGGDCIYASNLLEAVIKAKIRMGG